MKAEGEVRNSRVGKTVELSSSRKNRVEERKEKVKSL